VTLALRVLWVIHRYRRLGAKSNNAAVIGGFHDILNYLKFLDVEMAPGETAMQLARKIDSYPRFDHDRLRMQDVARIFSKACYSGHEIKQGEREIVERAIQNLDRRVLRQTGKPRYLYYRYVMNRI
jgi:hypothetical protein